MTQDEIIALADEAGFDIEPADKYHDKDEVLDSGNQWITPRIEKLVKSSQHQIVERIKKQILEEICFKMAAGSPNRRRIHELMETWE